MARRRCTVAVQADNRWVARYRESNRPLYPTEWVVRTLAGANYPKMKIDRSLYTASSILDLSCGDGRNLQLLQDLGFKVYATEIAQGIVGRLRRKARASGWRVKFSVGRSDDIPFRSRFFDFVLACSSFYYLGERGGIERVVSEIARVVRPGGFFIANVPDHRNSVVRDARLFKGGAALIRSDPFQLRTGTRWFVVRNRAEIKRVLEPHFEDIRIGRLADDYYGLSVSGYMFVCRRRAT